MRNLFFSKEKDKNHRMNQRNSHTFILTEENACLTLSNEAMCAVKKIF